MKNHRVVLFTTLIVLVLRGTVMAQWVQMTPNYGQNVLAFTEQGGNLLAGTDNGVFLSTDNGTNWKASGLTGSTVQALEVSGGNVFAGTTNGIYISVNDGGSWTFIGMSGLSVTGFAAVGSKIFVATYGDGVYAGMGIDSNWTPSGLSSGNLTAIDTLVGRIFVSMAGGGVFCSSDSGETWLTANNGMWTTDVSCLLINGTNIYAGTDVGVFMSSNQGSNWNPINSGWSDICNAPANALAYAGGNIIAGADNSNKHSIVLSTDQGGSWVPSVTNVGVGVEVLAAFGTDIFAGTSMGGVFRSTDAGLTWEGMGLAGGHYSEAGGCLAVSGNNLYLGFKGGGVLLSTDDGESWVGVNRGLVNSYVTALQVNGKDLFAGTSNGLFLTTDGGSNWNEIGFWGKSVSSVSSSGGTILTGTGEGLYVSTNSGFTWRFASEVVGDYGPL